MPRASIPTLLPLDTFATIVGINPAHFAGAAGGTIMPAGGACSDVWFQYDWQSTDRTSREGVARAIREAEEDVARWLGYWPGPKFFTRELVRPHKHHRVDALGGNLDAAGMVKAFRTKWGRIVGGGRRATTLLATVTTGVGGGMAYSDADADSYNETVTITVATALTDACEIKVYFAGHTADPAWEIRPARTKVITGGNVVMTFWAWQFITPALQEAFPTDAGVNAQNITGAIYVASAEVYREYLDSTQVSAQLLWENQTADLALGDCTVCGGSGCEVCVHTTQDGCLHVREPMQGLAVVVPATYASGQWSQDPFDVCREPDLIRIWYQAGDKSDEFQSGYSCEPVPHWLAEVISWLAVCKLERGLCGCKNLMALSQDWRRDLAHTPSDGDSFFLAERDASNPFGTMKGQVRAWRRLSLLARGDRMAKVAVI